MKLTPEQIEENLACYKQAMETGNLNGIQYYDDIRDEWGYKAITDTFHPTSVYRRKPTPTLRPWKPEEVPLGATIRLRGGPLWMGTITGRDSTSVCVATTWFPYGELKEIGEHTLDPWAVIANGTARWIPCGVEDGR